MRGFVDIFFRIVSIFGHPILYPTYFSLMVRDMFNLSVTEVFFFTFIVPLLALTIVFGAKIYKMEAAGLSGKIEQFFDSTKNRTYALSLMLVCFFPVIMTMRDNVTILTVVYILAALSTVFCLLINNFWRVSIHSFCCGFVLYLILIEYSILFENHLLVSVFSILASGLVVSSRLYLGRHNNLQVHLGFLLGFIIPAIFFMIIP